MIKGVLGSLQCLLGLDSFVCLFGGAQNQSSKPSSGCMDVWKQSAKFWLHGCLETECQGFCHASFDIVIGCQILFFSV